MATASKKPAAKKATLDDEARRDDNCENDSFSTTADIFSASTTDSGKESLLSLLSDEESFTSRASNYFTLCNQTLG